MLDAGRANLPKLLVSLDFRPVGTKEIEPAGIDDGLHIRVVDFKQIALEQAFGSRFNAKQGIATPQHALEAADNVMPPGRWPPGEKYRNALALRRVLNNS